MAFSSTGPEIKSRLGEGPYFFQIRRQIYHFVSPLHPNETSQDMDTFIRILDSVEATKQLENQSNQVCMAEVKRWLDETVRQVNLFSETCK
jgi:hypothetical protein